MDINWNLDVHSILFSMQLTRGGGGTLRLQCMCMSITCLYINTQYMHIGVHISKVPLSLWLLWRQDSGKIRQSLNAVWRMVKHILSIKTQTCRLNDCPDNWIGFDGCFQFFMRTPDHHPPTFEISVHYDFCRPSWDSNGAEIICMRRIWLALHAKQNGRLLHVCYEIAAWDIHAKVCPCESLPGIWTSKAIQVRPVEYICVSCHVSTFTTNDSWVTSLAQVFSRRLVPCGITGIHC